MANSVRSLNLNSMGQALSGLYLTAESLAANLGDHLAASVIDTSHVLAALEAVYGEELARTGLERHLGDKTLLGVIDQGDDPALLFAYTPSDENVADLRSGDSSTGRRDTIPPWIGLGVVGRRVRKGDLPSGGVSSDPAQSEAGLHLRQFVGFGRAGLFSSGDDGVPKVVPEEEAQELLDMADKTLEELKKPKDDDKDKDPPKPQEPSGTDPEKYPADPWGEIGGSSEPPPGFEKVFPSLVKGKIGPVDIDYPPEQRVAAPKFFEASDVLIPPTADDGEDPRTNNRVMSEAELEAARRIMEGFVPEDHHTDPPPPHHVVAAGVRALAHALSGSRLMLDETELAEYEGQIVQI